MPHSTWIFTIKVKMNNGGSTRVFNLSNVHIQVQSHQNWPTEYEKIQAITDYIEERYSGTIVDLDIIECKR